MRNSNILWKLIEDKVVLLDMDEGRAITLNEVGSYIWTSLEKQKTEEELLKSITAIFDIDEKTVRKDVFSFIDDMIKRDLIRVNSYTKNHGDTEYTEKHRDSP